VLQPLAKTPGAAQKRESAAERRRKGGERLGPAKVQGSGRRRGGRSGVPMHPDFTWLLHVMRTIGSW